MALEATFKFVWMLHEFTAFAFITSDWVPIYLSVWYLHEGGGSCVSRTEAPQITVFMSKALYSNRLENADRVLVPCQPSLSPALVEPVQMAQLLSGFGSKLRGAGFEPMPGRMCVI